MEFNSRQAAWDVNQIFADLESQMLKNRKDILQRAYTQRDIDFRSFVHNSFAEFDRANNLSAQNALAQATKLTRNEFNKAQRQSANEVDRQMNTAKNHGYKPKRQPESALSEIMSTAFISAVTGFATALTVAKRSAQQQLAVIANNVNANAPDMAKEIDRVQLGIVQHGITGKIDKAGNEKSMSAEAEFLFRNEQQNAYREAKGKRLDEYGEHRVLISAHPSSCPLCLPWQTKILVDDVFSDGKPDGTHELMSTAINAGFNHFNCRHGWIPYIEGFTDPKFYDKDKASVKETAERYVIEQQQRYNERMIRQYRNIALSSQDEVNRRLAERKVAEWQERQRALAQVADSKGIPFYRQYSREQIGGNTQPTVSGIAGNSSAKSIYSAFYDNRKASVQTAVSDRVEYKSLSNSLQKYSPYLPKTVEEFEDLKYNKIDQYERLLREEKEIKKILAKEKDAATYTEKKIKTYYEFREGKAETTDHSINRYLGQKNKKTQFTMEDVFELNKREAQYVDKRNGRLVKFDKDKNLALIVNGETGVIVTMESTTKISKNWEKL